MTDDDNWDNDFATTISPSALHLPHVKGQDNFGGLLSGDRLKAFASSDSHREETENWDSSFEGELVTIKDLGHWSEVEPQEETIRPLRKKPEKTRESKAQQVHRRQKSDRGVSNAAQSKSPVRPLGTKFELPPRPDVIYREQSVEDYSDLFADNDHVFDRRLNLVSKVALPPTRFHLAWEIQAHLLSRIRRNCSTPRTSLARRSRRSRPPAAVRGDRLVRHGSRLSLLSSQ